MILDPAYLRYWTTIAIIFAGAIFVIALFVLLLLWLILEELKK